MALKRPRHEEVCQKLDEHDGQNLFWQSSENCFLAAQYLMQIQSGPIDHNSGSLYACLSNLKLSLH